jgi:hypothetical protein
MDLDLTKKEMERLELRIKNNPDLREKYEDYKIIIKAIERLEYRIKNNPDMEKAVNEEYDHYIVLIKEVENILPTLKEYAKEIKKEFEI